VFSRLQREPLTRLRSRAESEELNHRYYITSPMMPKLPESFGAKLPPFENALRRITKGNLY
jgi:hypothetical protein